MSWKQKLYESRISESQLIAIEQSLDVLEKLPHVSQVDGSLRNLIDTCERITAYKKLYNDLNQSAAWYVKHIQLAANAEQFIHDNCQPFLQQADGRLLYRGVKVPPRLHAKKIVDVRTNRMPTDSPLPLHAALNSVIARHNLVANRSNSLFCTGNLNFAQEFGVAHRVYPIGEFNYTWDRNIADQAADYNERVARTYMELRMRTFLLRHATLVKDILEGHHFLVIDRQSNKDIPSGAVMANKSKSINNLVSTYLKSLDGEYGEYIAAEASILKDVIYERLEYHVLEDYLSKVACQFRGDDGTLVEAIDSGHEVMLHCKQAVMV